MFAGEDNVIAWSLYDVSRALARIIMNESFHYNLFKCSSNQPTESCDGQFQINCNWGQSVTFTDNWSHGAYLTHANGDTF